MNKYKGYGAILGDIVGSVYEMNPIYTKEFEFFDERSHWTDDTIMTLATMSKLMNDSSYTLEYKWWGNRYYGDYYGKNFKEWIKREDWTSNDSFGNGAGMRVSPVGYTFNNAVIMMGEAEASANASHDNEQARKGATSIVALIAILHHTTSRDTVKKFVEAFAKTTYGILYPNILKPFEKFKVSCDYTIPVAIKCFVEGKDLEDTIRLAVSLGGDCDTIASMAAELRVAYDGGMEQKYVDFVRSKLDPFQLMTLDNFNNNDNERESSREPAQSDVGETPS